MYKVNVNSQTEFQIELQKPNNNLVLGSLNGNDISVDIIKIRDGVYHLIKDNTSYNLEIVKYSIEDKKMTVKVNNTSYTLDIKDKYDELLHSLGLDKLATKKVNELPGWPIFN